MLGRPEDEPVAEDIPPFALGVGEQSHARLEFGKDEAARFRDDEIWEPATVCCHGGAPTLRRLRRSKVRHPVAVEMSQVNHGRLEFGFAHGLTLEGGGHGAISAT